MPRHIRSLRRRRRVRISRTSRRRGWFWLDAVVRESDVLLGLDLRSAFRDEGSQPMTTFFVGCEVKAARFLRLR